MSRLLVVVGYLLGYFLTLCLLTIWMVAHVTGNPVLVSINEFGEQYVELVLWMGVTAVMTVGLAELVHDESPA